MLHHVLDCLLHGPVQGVDPSVHHQSAGSEHLRPQVAKPHQRIIIEAKLVAQGFTVETPAFTEASVYWEPKTVLGRVYWGGDTFSSLIPGGSLSVLGGLYRSSEQWQILLLLVE